MLDCALVTLIGTVRLIASLYKSPQYLKVRLCLPTSKYLSSSKVEILSLIPVLLFARVMFPKNVSL